MCMKVAKSEAYLSTVELGSFLWEESLFSEVMEQLPTVHVLEYEAQPVCRRERILQVLHTDTSELSRSSSGNMSEQHGTIIARDYISNIRI